MKPSTLLREPARLVMHLNEGFTKVALERTSGSGLADGGVCWDIPTDRIPFHLRAMGSRFLVVCQTYQPEPHDSAEAIRAGLYDDISIEESPKAEDDN